MEFERLAIEVGATKAGLKPVVPRTVQGESGVVHSFSLLFSDGGRVQAFDIYDSVSEIEVVKSYAKKLDTGCPVNIVCPEGNVTEGAGRLAASYGIRIVSPEAAAALLAPEKAHLQHRSN
ncbi:MAG: hypothetical protein JRN11_05780 [Nitrososphaerota archaeon]|nr:hypothetical protein [Nitrososphaerota archaeon]MDG7026241.1 hypothetical protein [Nitrososphaerota archaeon]